MKIKISTGLALLVLIASSSALSAVPELIPVQGVLTSPDGNAIDGLVDIHFSLYTSESVSTPLWTESYDGDNQVFVDQGFFTVYLGSLIGLPVAEIVSSSELWLGISVGADAEMERVRLAAVPFAVECLQIGDLKAEDIQPKVNIGGDTSVGDCGAGQVVQGIDPATGAISCVTDNTGSTGGNVVSISGVTPIATYDDGNGNVTVEVSVGIGSEDVAAGNHTHFGEYLPDVTCANIGHVIKYTGSGWTCSPDIDTNTTYSNGTGLSLTDTTFSVNFGGNGSAVTAARSDHNHNAAYVQKIGDSMTGSLSVISAGSTGVTATGNIGVSGTTNCTTSTCYGVYGSNNGSANAYAGYFNGNVGISSGNLTITNGTMRYANNQTGYFSVAASAFTPFSSAVAYSGAGNGAYRYINSGASERELDASVSLPHGVTVNNMSCYVVDSSASYDITVGLVAVLVNQWACGPFSSNGSNASVQSLGGACTTTINNDTEVYHLRMLVSNSACGGNCLLYGCKISYLYNDIVR